MPCSFLPPLRTCSLITINHDGSIAKASLAARPYLGVGGVGWGGELGYGGKRYELAERVNTTPHDNKEALIGSNVSRKDIN